MGTEAESIARSDMITTPVAGACEAAKELFITVSPCLEQVRPQPGVNGMKDTVGQSPFNVGGEWSWPQAFGVQVEGETAVIRVSLPDNEPVELRALMLIEASTAEVLKHAISRVRIEFVGPKNRGPAEHAALRLGLFSDDVRSRFELRHDGRIIPIVDVVSDLPDLPLDLKLPPESFTGNGFAPFGRALDAVLERISSASEGTDEIEGAPISVV
jgi:hypothetical protein